MAQGNVALHSVVLVSHYQDCFCFSRGTQQRNIFRLWVGLLVTLLSVPLHIAICTCPGADPLYHQLLERVKQLNGNQIPDHPRDQVDM